MRGYFGVAAYRLTDEKNVGGLWRSAAAYGAAFLGTVGIRYGRLEAADTTAAWRHTPLLHFAHMDALLGALPRGCALIGVELDPRAVSLERFEHPQRALYLLGAERHGLPPDVLDRCDHLVQIPTIGPWSLNVASAGTVVLAHRHMSRLREGAPIMT